MVSTHARFYTKHGMQRHVKNQRSRCIPRILVDDGAEEVRNLKSSVRGEGRNLNVLRHWRFNVYTPRILYIGQAFRYSPENAFYVFNPYPTAFPYGNGMVLHFYQQQESSTTKTVHKVINKRLKTYV